MKEKDDGEDILGHLKAFFAKMSLDDLTAAGLPADLLPGMVVGKLELIRMLMRNDFVPVEACSDGRVIMQYVGDDPKYITAPFRQVHGMLVSEMQFGMLSYAVPTIEGIPLSDEAEMARIKKVTLKKMSERGKDAPAMAEPAAPEDKRTLH